MLRILLEGNPDYVQWIILGAAACAIVFLLFRSKSRKRDSPTQGVGVEQDVRSLMSELTEMSRRMSTQLDSRSDKLQNLIKQADEKVEELRSASSASRNSPASVAPAPPA